MSNWTSLFLLLVSVLSSQRAPAAELPYSEKARVAKIVRSLAAFREAKAQQAEELERYLSSIARGACRAEDDSLVSTCLEQHARRNCAAMTGRAANRCAAMSDVIITNQVNEKQFISREERFALLQKSGATTFSAAFSKIVLRKYALVTTEFLLSQPDCPAPAAGSGPKPEDDETACLARSIDQYCLKHADVRNLPWQGCAASIIWFMGTSG